jgi:hypothetical protein
MIPHKDESWHSLTCATNHPPVETKIISCLLPSQRKTSNWFIIDLSVGKTVPGSNLLLLIACHNGILRMKIG